MEVLLIAVSILSLSKLVCYFIRKRSDSNLDRFVRDFPKK